jgi:signal transduction histidine kinase
MTEGLKSELSGKQQEDAARIFELVRQAIHQVRQLSHTMSPAAVQHRELADSLRLLAENVRSSFRRDCDSDLDTAVKVRDGVISGHLFRIAQEAINNGIRHGNPKHLSISLKRDGNEHGLLEITNDGESFDCRPGSPAEGIGIRVMKHRASLIQAALSITSPPSGGIRVACRFPLPPADRPSPPTKPKR